MKKLVEEYKDIKKERSFTLLLVSIIAFIVAIIVFIVHKDSPLLSLGFVVYGILNLIIRMIIIKIMNKKIAELEDDSNN